MKEKSHEIYCLLDSGFEEEEESSLESGDQRPESPWNLVKPH